MRILYDFGIFEHRCSQQWGTYKQGPVTVQQQGEAHYPRRSVSTAGRRLASSGVAVRCRCRDPARQVQATKAPTVEVVVARTPRRPSQSLPVLGPKSLRHHQADLHRRPLASRRQEASQATTGALGRLGTPRGAVLTQLSLKVTTTTTTTTTTTMTRTPPPRK